MRRPFSIKTLILAWGSCSTTWELLTESSRQKINAVYDLFELRLEHRFPERKAGQAFLSGAAKRGEAVMDLLWSVLNTREFLFQH